MSKLPVNKRWARYLCSKNGLTSEQEEILAYVIELILTNVLNIFCTLLLGLFLGVFPGTLTCLVTVALFRQLAGGAHSKSPRRCALVTIITFPTLALAATFFARLSPFYVDTISIIAVLVSLAYMITLAPVDSPEAPIISSRRRKKLKYLSVLAVLLVAFILFYLRQGAWKHAGEVGSCLILSLLWITFILSGSGHKLFSFIDKANIPRGGVLKE